MISVEIAICGRPIFRVEALNVTEPWKGNSAAHTYQCNNGAILKHVRNRGAIKLAIKMLKTLKEDFR